MFSELPQRCKENTKYSHLWSWNFDLFLLEKDLNWLINYQNNWELFVTPNSLQLLKHAELLLYCKWTVFWQPLKALYNTGHVDCRGQESSHWPLRLVEPQPPHTAESDCRWMDKTTHLRMPSLALGNGNGHCFLKMYRKTYYLSNQGNKLLDAPRMDSLGLNLLLQDCKTLEQQVDFYPHILIHVLTNCPLSK